MQTQAQLSPPQRLPMGNNWIIFPNFQTAVKAARKRPLRRREQVQATSKLFRREVTWTQCFHWPNKIMCGKYPCLCVMPERYFNFTCCSENASTHKKRILILVFVLMTASRQFSRWNKNYCVLVFALVAVASENKAWYALLPLWLLGLYPKTGKPSRK